MAIKSFKRYEKNYTIYNIYYDTKDNQVISHSFSSPAYKEKLRLRNYYVPKDPKNIVFLELKKKINGIVNKRRVILRKKLPHIESKVNIITLKGYI